MNGTPNKEASSASRSSSVASNNSVGLSLEDVLSAMNSSLPQEQHQHQHQQQFQVQVQPYPNFLIAPDPMIRRPSDGTSSRQFILKLLNEALDLADEVLEEEAEEEEQDEWNQEGV